MDTVVSFIIFAGLEKELRDHVGHVIGGIAKPDDIHFTPALPKTRSGKIIRRWLKELVTTVDISGNITTPEDVSVAKIPGTYFRNNPPE